MSDKKSTIIIKRVKKISAGAHGGSWKVAYADFVTAMMAFFLLMWLLSMSSAEKRIRLSAYFKNFSIFEKSGSSFMEKSSEMFNQAGESTDRIDPDSLGKASGINVKQKQEAFKESLKSAVEAKLGDIKDQITIDTIEGGVRIQLVDKEGKPMFDLGSPRPSPLATRIMSVLGEQIKELPNPVSVEGHTDALAFKSESRSNWDLSTERALAARQTLEGFGVDPKRVSRVAGYADTVPYIRENPDDPRNRRISIILLFPQAAAPLGVTMGPNGVVLPEPVPQNAYTK